MNREATLNTTLVIGAHGLNLYKPTNATMQALTNAIKIITLIVRAAVDTPSVICSSACRSGSGTNSGSAKVTTRSSNARTSAVSINPRKSLTDGSMTANV